MKPNQLSFSIAIVFFLGAMQSALAAQSDVYELIYNEQEPGTDVYEVRFVVSDEYIRIDNSGDAGDDGGNAAGDDMGSGYIVYDHNKRTIYSVSHFDKSILVIPHYEYTKPDIENKVKATYKALTDAPKISDKTVYSYTAHADSEKCMDIQLVSGLLPEVTKILKAYQGIVAGQQVKFLKTTPVEYQTACFLYDQVYNDGKYYEKGLPIQEWHSNGKQRILVSYKKIQVDSNIYDLPNDYREYSLD
jgi:hypothetical protein